MIEIRENALYRRSELVELMGRSAFLAAQAAGLCAVGGVYHGRFALDCHYRASESKASQRAASRKGGDHEKAKMAARVKNQCVHATSSARGAEEFLRALEEGGG